MIKNSSSLFFLLTAAQFLGTGDPWEIRGACFGLGAEPQVHQHLSYEDTGHVDRDTCWSGNINNPCAGRSAVGYIFVVVQQLGEALCHWCFYTHTCWISTNQRLYKFCFWNHLYRICFWFLEMYVLSLLVLSSYFYQCCIINGKRWLYNLHLGCIINSEFWY